MQRLLVDNARKQNIFKLNFAQREEKNKIKYAKYVFTLLLKSGKSRN